MKTRGCFAFWRQAATCRRLVYAAALLLCLMAAALFALSAPPAPPGGICIIRTCGNSRQH